MIKIIAVLLIFYISCIVCTQYGPCQLREYENGFVCVCNETYCDALDFTRPANVGDYVIVSSTKSGKRFVSTEGNMASARIKCNRPLCHPPNFPTVIRVRRQKKESDDIEEIENWFTTTLHIDSTTTYQTIEGFGGAFTGTVSHLLDSMSKSIQHTIYRQYYSQEGGIAYNFMRIPIGGCDFDLEPWAYNESPVDDTKLSNFSRLDARDLRRLAQLKELKDVAQNHDIKLMGAAWSPPRWMKSNNEWSGRAWLKPEYYQTWADYHLQYLHLMARENVSFWAISTGNEPLNGEIGWFFIRFMSLGWTPEHQGKWVSENLGPTLNASEFKNVKLFAGDDQRYTMPWLFDHMNLGDENAMSYISGLAVHWYWDRLIPPVVLDKSHVKYSNKIILNTESCLGDKPFETHGPLLGSWYRAEKYALGIIQDLQHWVGGWIDWNLILDLNGGPTYIDNTVDAAIIMNKTEFYKQPIFYVIAHFSKFIPPGSIRIRAWLRGLRQGGIKIVAFLCPDNTITVILYNKSNRTKKVLFRDDLRGSMELQLESKSIHSFIFA